MMIKVPSGNENASIELTELAVGKEDSAEEKSNELYEKNNDLPLSCVNEGDDLISFEEETRKGVTEKEEQARKSFEKIDWPQLGIEQECQDVNGNTRLREDMEDGQPKASEMDLPGGRNLCGQHSGKKYSHHVCLDKVIHEDATMHQKSAAASTVSKEFIETYCRTLEELEKCRGKITRLSQENSILVQKLEEYDWNRECHRKEMQAEKQFRERIQNDLRKIVKDMECHQPEVWTEPKATASSSTDVDIEYFKDQLKVYQEDFKQEKAEKLKLRELNSLLTTELEEAKQTIESQQKKLIVYAQIFSNGSGAQFVIPPAYIGRRVRSNPSSPSYTHLYPGRRNTQHFTELHDDNDQRERSIDYDPIYDVVPKGSTMKPDKARQGIERRTSVP